VTATIAVACLAIFASSSSWLKEQLLPKTSAPLDDSAPWRIATSTRGTQDHMGSGLETDCNIERMDIDAWQRRFQEHHLKRPAIVRSWRPEHTAKLQEATTRSELLRRFSKSLVLTATPAELARGGQKVARTPVSLYEYVKGMPGLHYLFDDGSFLRQSKLDGDWHTLPGLAGLGTFDDGRSNTTTRVAVGEASTREISGPALTLALGGDGQGVTFHVHGDSYSLQLHGKKRWAIYAPGSMTRSGFSRVETFSYWLEHRQGGEAFTAPQWHCVQEEGETLYIPEGFYHAAVCVNDSVSFVHQAERLDDGSAFQAFVSARRLLAQSSPNVTQVHGLLTRAIELDWTNSDYWMELGVLYASILSWTEAEAAFRKSVDVNPLNDDAWRNLATALIKLGRRWEALWLRLRHR